MRIFLALLACLILLPQAASAQTAFAIQAEGSASESGLATLWSDVDGDDRTDLLVINVSGRHTLFRNDGAGGLEAAVPFSLPTVNVGDGVFADLDGDGDRDLLLGSLAGSGYYENVEGEYQSRDVNGLTNRSDVRSVEPVDVDRDGLLDLFVSRREGRGNYLLKQLDTGGWAFTFVEPDAGAGPSNQTCWSDWDADGDLDAFVVNSAGAANIAYRNTDGFLSEVTTGAEGTGALTTSSCAWGDVDADGDFDLFLTKVGGAPSELYLNDGAGALTPAPPETSPQLSDDAVSARWDDIDLDGDLDLISVGRYTPLRVHFNEGGAFTEVVIDGPNASPSYRTALATFDLDGDGDLELAMTAGFNGSFEPSAVFRNDLATAPGWIGVRLRSGTRNTEGIGARVTAFTVVGGEPVAQVREVRAHSSRLAQSDMTVMFGLGQGGAVDSVRVDWPNGEVTVEVPAATGRVLTLTDKSFVSTAEAPMARFEISVRPNPSAPGAAAARVTVPAAGEVTIEVFDVLGRRVWHVHREAAPGDLEIRVPRLAAGSYVLRARSGGESAVRQLTVAR